MKLNHLAIPYLAVLAFMFGGILESGGIGWYRTLTLPSWSPAEGVVALAWAVIYVCAAWSLLIVWNRFPRDWRFAWAMAGFAAVTLANLAWSLVFFRFHLLALSPWCALLVAALAVALSALVYPRSKKAAFLLVPYIAWVLFAAYLNHAVALLNS